VSKIRNSKWPVLAFTKVELPSGAFDCFSSCVLQTEKTPQKKEKIKKILRKFIRNFHQKKRQS
jgi:hypothetical protein